MKVILPLLLLVPYTLCQSTTTTDTTTNVATTITEDNTTTIVKATTTVISSPTQSMYSCQVMAIPDGCTDPMQTFGFNNITYMLTQLPGQTDKKQCMYEIDENHYFKSDNNLLECKADCNDKTLNLKDKSIYVSYAISNNNRIVIVTSDGKAYIMTMSNKELNHEDAIERTPEPNSVYDKFELIFDNASKILYPVMSNNYIAFNDNIRVYVYKINDAIERKNIVESKLMSTQTSDADTTRKILDYKITDDYLYTLTEYHNKVTNKVLNTLHFYPNDKITGKSDNSGIQTTYKDKATSSLIKIYTLERTNSIEQSGFESTIVYGEFKNRPEKRIINMRDIFSTPPSRPKIIFPSLGSDVVVESEEDSIDTINAGDGIFLSIEKFDDYIVFLRSDFIFMYQHKDPETVVDTTLGSIIYADKNSTSIIASAHVAKITNTDTTSKIFHVYVIRAPNTNDNFSKSGKSEICWMVHRYD